MLYYSIFFIPVPVPLTHVCLFRGYFLLFVVDDRGLAVVRGLNQWAGEVGVGLLWGAVRCLRE